MSNAANMLPTEDAQLEAAVAWLRARLPDAWQADRSQRMLRGAADATARTLDAGIDVRAGNGTTTTLAVEARRSFTPRDAELLFSGVARSLRALADHIPVLVVTPWLSPRAQELLTDEGINYIDLTGNARVQLGNPALFLSSTGAPRNPAPAARGQARLRGPKAGRLVRLLADVRPPYGVRDIAAAAGLNPGYVSRLLDALDREAAIARDPRGPVRSVDLAALLRHWAQSYDVFKANNTTPFLAPAGTAAVLEQLGETKQRVAITGSFAAVRRAPVAAPALLMLYCDDVPAVADELRLLPADTGANVALLRPFDPVVWSRTTIEDGISYAAVSQVAVDCLTGNGRMPAEGEALLKWMAEDEGSWRASSLDEFVPIGGPT